MSSFHLIFFLGAVRDMTSKENKILQTVTNQLGIELVGIRLGTVPEFTSKILSILAYHHSQSNNILGIAIERLLLLKSSDTGPTTTALSPPQVQNLNIVCTVPLLSTEITTSLKERCRVHWCLVRIIVTTLYRSRLIGASSDNKHSNQFYLDNLGLID